MDPRNTIVSELTIQNGRIETVGRGGNARLSPCTKTIDLRGRTAVPGLIDNHNHIVLLGIRPGHDTRLETAASIADVQAALKARAQDRARRRVHHRHGRLEPGAIRREAAADAGRARRGRARPSGPRVPGVHRSGRHQYTRESVLDRERRGRERRGPDWRQRPLAGGAQCVARRSDAGRSQTRDARCAGLLRQRRRHDERGHGGVSSSRPPGYSGLIHRRHARDRRSLPHVRRDHRAPSREQGLDARAPLLPQHGHEARCADVEAAPAQHVQRLRRRHAAGVGHRRVRHELAAVRPAGPDQLRRRAAGDREAGVGVSAAQSVASRGSAHHRRIRNREPDDADRAVCAGRSRTRRASTCRRSIDSRRWAPGLRCIPSDTWPAPRAPGRRSARSSTAGFTSAPGRIRRRSRPWIRG